MKQNKKPQRKIPSEENTFFSFRRLHIFFIFQAWKNSSLKQRAIIKSNLPKRIPRLSTRSVGECIMIKVLWAEAVPLFQGMKFKQWMKRRWNIPNLFFTVIVLNFKLVTITKNIYKVMKILPRFKTVLVTTFGYKKEIQHWETCLYYVLQFQTTVFF